MLAAIDQREVMAAVMGGDPENAIAPIGFLQSGKPEVDQAGMAAVRTRRSPAEVKAMLDRAGYAGERLVLLHPSDHVYYNPTSSVVSQLLSECGFNIDDQVMDWARCKLGAPAGSRWPMAAGRCSAPWRRCRITAIPCWRRSFAATGRRAGSAGPRTRRWRGFTKPGCSPPTRGSRHRLETAYQLRAFEFLPFIPLGRFLQTSAWRDNARGILKGPSAVFWNVEKA